MYIKYFLLHFFPSVFDHQNPGYGLGLDPDSLEMLDADPDSMISDPQLWHKEGLSCTPLGTSWVRRLITRYYFSIAGHVHQEVGPEERRARQVSQQCSQGLDLWALLPPRYVKLPYYLIFVCL